MIDAINRANQNPQKTPKKTPNRGLNTITAASIGAGTGFVASHFIYDKEIKESTKYIKNPDLIHDSIVAHMGESFKKVSISDLDEYVQEGVKQNKEYVKHLKTLKLAWVAAGATALTAAYLGGKSLLGKKDKA
jgi:hypothetical protein